VVHKEVAVTRKINRFMLGAIVIGVAVSLTACPTFELQTFPGHEDVDLSDAQIDSIYPEVVLPGTIFGIFGDNFGEAPGVVTMGDTQVSEFVDWRDDAIFFKVPETVSDGDGVAVGDDVYDADVIVAPEDSITVEWRVDIHGADEIAEREYEDFRLDAPPKLEPPMYIKGQWAKSGGTNMGVFDSGWDGGATVPMARAYETNVWISQTVFTPEAIASFDGEPMLFAFEDDNLEDRNLSQWESDAANVMKRYWAQNDRYEGIRSDPGVLISPENPNYDSGENLIVKEYPL